MLFTQEKTSDGVTQRDFSVSVNDETVPCTLWVPADAPGPRPLIAMGHGGSQHKKALGIRRRAAAYASTHGWASLAIDAPGHGDRISREEAAALIREVGARVRGDDNARPLSAGRLKDMATRSSQAVPEWQAALDAVQGLDFVGDTQPLGYWGVSMGTAIGVPLLAVEPRFCCAVLGLAGLRAGAEAFAEAAAAIHIPVQFVFQWDDAVAPREAGLALFDTFGSKQKTMHINPGPHVEIPSFENAAWEAFYLRHFAAATAASG